MRSPRLELGTLSVLDSCDNQLHHDPIACPDERQGWPFLSAKIDMNLGDVTLC